MAPTSDDVYKVLQSIDGSLKALVAHFGANARPATSQTVGTGAVAAIASDRDLDSQHGNPEVKTKDPRDWTGDTMRGKRFSECSADYLNQYAPFLDWMADQSQAQAEDPATPTEDAKKALTTVRYKRLDASRARGWAARKRAGWQPPPEDPSAFGTEATGDIDASAIPF